MGPIELARSALHIPTKHDPRRSMTSRPFTNAGRPLSRLHDSDANAPGSDRPSVALEHDVESRGVQVISTALLGLTVVGAIAMLGFNWTSG